MKNKKFLAITTSLILMLALVGCTISGDLSREELGNAASSAASAATAAVSDLLDAADGLSDVASTAAEKLEGAAEKLESAAEKASAAKAAAQDTSGDATGLLTSAEDLDLRPTDDKGVYYAFTYGGEEFTARYTEDHWKIMDSYKINSESDMTIICQALIDLHPIHGKDMVSYRTADDMVYEWAVHNLGYMMVTGDDDMKEHLKDVDFDPQDQGCSFDEIYYNHTGKELDLGTILGG